MLSIFWNLKSKVSPEMWELFLTSWDTGKYTYVLFALLLMPVNWLLETSKFYLLMNLQFKTRFALCIKAIFAGVSIAIFTPNRVGEYAGRILLFPKSKHQVSIWSTIIGNYAQIIAIVSFGIFGFYKLALSQGYISPIFSRNYVLINCTILLFISILFFNPYPILKKIFRAIPVKSWRDFLLKSLHPIRQFSVDRLIIVLLLSITRYLTFGSQFYLTLCFFNVKLNPTETFQSISSVYLLKTTIPYPPAFGFLMRGEISAWVFQFFTQNLIAVIAASMLIWIINVVIPALLGYLILVRENWLKKLVR